VDLILAALAKPLGCTYCKFELKYLYEDAFQECCTL